MGMFDDVIAAATTAIADAPEAVQYENEQQQTREWFRKRLGMFTASCVDDLMKKGKGTEWGLTALKVVQRVKIERSLSPEGIELYLDEQMYKEFRSCAWGNKYETIARIELSKELGLIDQVGSTVHPELPFFSGSADGICRGIPLEIKCPYNILVHDANLQMDVIDEKNDYYGQNQSHIMRYESKQGIFASYDPRRINPMNLKYWIVDRDEAYITRLVDRLKQANEMAKV